MIKLVVTGGGTGGHLFPGIAVSEAFVRRFPGSEVLFIGTDRNMDVKTLTCRGFKTAFIRCGGLKGKSILSRLRTLVELPFGLLHAAIVIRRFRPALVFGVGGYVTGPVVLAAKFMGIATCIHEQNSIPGLANRILGRLVDRVFLSIPGSERFFSCARTILTGNPIRKELLVGSMTQDSSVTQNEGGVTLLVLGGSQGARRVNELVTGALGMYKLPQDFQVIHQTGVDDEPMVRDFYEKLGIKARVSSFISDMAEVYAKADLVVSRAGATTLAEIAVVGKPAILIPYPFAADGHQEKNGEYLVEAGCALMFIQNDLDEEILGKEIVSLLADKGRIEMMKAAAIRIARPQAAEAILDNCVALLAEKGISL